MTARQIALTLREARRRAGLTQQEAAHLSAISYRTIQRLEKYGTLDLGTLAVLSEAYNIHLVRLIFPESAHRAIVMDLLPNAVKNYFQFD